MAPRAPWFFACRMLVLIPVMFGCTGGGSHPNDGLFPRIRAGDAEGVQTLLQQGASCNLRTADGVSALGEAVRVWADSFDAAIVSKGACDYRNDPTVAALLKAGADPSTLPKDLWLMERDVTLAAACNVNEAVKKATHEFLARMILEQEGRIRLRTALVYAFIFKREMDFPTWLEHLAKDSLKEKIGTNGNAAVATVGTPVAFTTIETRDGHCLRSEEVCISPLRVAVAIQCRKGTICDQDSLREDVLRILHDRVGLEPEEVDLVVFGCED